MFLVSPVRKKAASRLDGIFSELYFLVTGTYSNYHRKNKLFSKKKKKKILVTPFQPSQAVDRKQLIILGGLRGKNSSVRPYE